jgi:hypothetical protein
MTIRYMENFSRKHQPLATLTGLMRFCYFTAASRRMTHLASIRAQESHDQAAATIQTAQGKSLAFVR